MKSTHPVTYVYDVEGHEVAVTREHVRTAYARNGNVGNPTEYFKWSATVDGESVTSWARTRADAYEYGRAAVLGYAYSPGHGDNFRGAKNVRNFRLVADEMQTNYQRREVDA
jgi:hypothetical protein